MKHDPVARLLSALPKAEAASPSVKDYPTVRLASPADLPRARRLIPRITKIHVHAFRPFFILSPGFLFSPGS